MQCAELNKNGTRCNHGGTVPIAGLYVCKTHLGRALLHLAPPDPFSIPDDAPVVSVDGVAHRCRALPPSRSTAPAAAGR